MMQLIETEELSRTVLLHNYEDLISLFNECFFSTHNTRLVKGDDEPLYLPADEHRPHNEIFFAHGFFASALHECAHWLIAGQKRRQLVDFGYWYEPDGRTSAQQALFQSVEVKPQAMEWILSEAAGSPFQVSIDNLNSSESDTHAFKLAVYTQVKTYCEQGLPKRAALFRAKLSHFYQTSPHLTLDNFNFQTLR
jgi:elongation factor P hydroxylase